MQPLYLFGLLGQIASISVRITLPTEIRTRRTVSFRIWLLEISALLRNLFVNVCESVLDHSFGVEMFVINLMWFLFSLQKISLHRGVRCKESQCHSATYDLYFGVHVQFSNKTIHLRVHLKNIITTQI